jgi:outer membrane lipoprotein-sorting protein
MQSRVLTTLLFLVTLAAAPVTPPDAWPSIQARMDKAASEFKAMTASGTYVTHTDVLDENSTEKGTMVMKKVQAGEVQGLINFLSADKRTYSFEKDKFRIYLPKVNTIQEWNLGKYAEQIDQLLMIGFGTSGTALAKDYDVRVFGPETVKGLEGKPFRVLFIPKAAEAKEHIKQLELWIPESGAPYPLQEKISAPSGDYRLITYSDIKINPVLPSDALQLKTAPGVKTVNPGK